jgi:hypothetical protein
MSGKSITLADLNEAIKPLIEAMNRMREECMSDSTQISETHRMVTSVSVKLDSLDQSVKSSATDGVRAAPKKLVGKKKGAVAKKPAAKKPAKRGAKKVAEPADEADEPDAGDPEEDVAEDDDAEPTAAEDDDAEPTAEDDAEPAEEDADSKKPAKAAGKKTVAKAPVKKAPAKKATKAPPVEKKKQFNRMNFFKKEYEADDKQFNKVLTAKVRAKVEAEEENAKKLDGLEGEARKRVEANIFYHYIKDNNPDVLEGLRAKFDAENAE